MMTHTVHLLGETGALWLPLEVIESELGVENKEALLVPSFHIVIYVLNRRLVILVNL